MFNVSVSNNDYIDFDPTGGNDISFTNFIDNDNLDTDSLNNTGKIIFTVRNSNPIQSDESFNVIVNIDISDTIYPIINFSDTYYSFSSSSPTSFRGDDGNNIFYTHIMIKQSYISSNPTRDFTQDVLAYDQVTNVVDEEIDVRITSTVTIPNPFDSSFIIPNIPYVLENGDQVFII